ncbi:MAG: hypothetical protein FJ030_16945 [Chloroflexi bacterium]|nr:hypothetical protein [Chloroflexota bacterium]
MQDTHHRLIDLLLAGGGLHEVAAELTRMVGRSVQIVSGAGMRLAGEVSSEGQDRLPDALRRVARNENPAASLIRDNGVALIPLVIQNEIEGWLVVEATEADDAAIAVLAQGATVTSLALIKHRAVQEAEQRFRRDLFEDMLASERWSAGRLTEQANSLGWQLDSIPIVILIDFGGARRIALAGRASDLSRRQWIREKFAEAARRAVSNHAPAGIVVERDAGLVILPNLSGKAPAEAHEHIQQIVEALEREMRASGLAVGYATAIGGHHHSGLDGLRQSYHEAQQALEIGLRLLMRRPIWFDDVQLYILLESFIRGDEARGWFSHTLGPLIEYDRRNRTQMVETMEAYFDANQSLQQAAHVLHVHANTLKYRLQRIRQVLKQDPFVGERQLAFYLAAKVARLLR